MNQGKDNGISDSDFIGGVYAPRRNRRVLHAEVVEFRMDKLRRRKPKIVDSDCFANELVIDDGQRKA